ncbi:MAG TPA: hypothetical protein VNM92_17960 [Thermoanaerobaculia bacterium]|nr:hypothetical protein [Thermoanaerobaculia bacterium]
MKKVIQALALLQMMLAPLTAAEPARCGSCAGIVANLDETPSATLPVLVRADRPALPALTQYLSRLSPEQRASATVVINVTLPSGGDPLLQIEEEARQIVAWAAGAGPFDAMGVRVEGGSPALQAFAIKRLSVLTQGLRLASRIVAGPYSSEQLSLLYESGANSYFDELLVEDGSFDEVAKWITEKDPLRKLSLVTSPTGSNIYYDAALGFRRGAWRVFLSAPLSSEASLVALNREFAGDITFDPGAGIELLDRTGTKRREEVLSFVRGSDLRRIVIPPGDPAASNIVTLPGEQYKNVRRVTGSTAATVADTGRKGGRFLIGFPPSADPFLLTIDRDERIDQTTTKDSLEVVTSAGISVEEIIRNHQSYRAFQDSIQPHYVAMNRTKLRFGVGDGGEAVEATIAGDYFASPSGPADWVWQDFFINGVRWKYGRIPELPLIQPEKVTQLPLDLQLTNDYRYVLAGDSAVRGFECYEVRFEPPAVAPEGLPLYRGTIWIEKKSWARIRVNMVQLNLSGEILSNEERIDFSPFETAGWRPLAPSDVAGRNPQSVLWLPSSVSAQQVLSTAGRSTVVLRSTELSEFNINPANWEERRLTANRSSARMVRETDRGLRYLERTPEGERIVQENFDTSRVFLLSGFHHDSGLEFPVVPLGGLDYFNFNLFNKGIQANLFFAGVIVNATASKPGVWGTRATVSGDFSGLAIPFANSMYREGREIEGETIKALPLRTTVRVGLPLFDFAKIDLALDVSHLSYQRAMETAPSFVVPQDTFILAPSLEGRYDRWGYSLQSFFKHGIRTRWAPWGIESEYDPSQKRYSQFGASLGKSFYLPRFQRLGLEMNYLSGSNLDRLSKYELGFFGAQRIRGVQSGSVRAERALLGHISYGFVFSQQFRLELFYDHGLITDRSSGYQSEPFQGVGLGGQTIGPWGTLLRTDFGKTIGRNAQDGFVANLVLLKLF